MGFGEGAPIKGTKIDVAFVGSCTNARLSDLREAARVVRGHHVAPHVQALVVPGSQAVRAAAEREGLDRVFTEAGFEWRGAGCSMCLAMNQDKLEGRQICASSSNRKFKGRQGSPTGRTLLMSPAMVAAAAVAGEVVDVRDFHNMAIERITRIQGRALPLARQRHRHGPDHPGAFPALGVVRGARNASLRRRHRPAAGRRTPATQSSMRASPARRSWSSTAISAADRRASTRRRRSGGEVSGRWWASRSRRSSSATRWRSVCRASAAPRLISRVSRIW